MKLPTTDFAEILQSPRFNVTTLRSRLDTMRKIALRITDEVGPWNEAILKASSPPPGGLMLIKYPDEQLEVFRVLHLSSASCGNSKPSVRYTASLLNKIGVGVSEAAVFTTLKAHIGFRVYGLNPSHNLAVPSLVPLDK